VSEDTTTSERGDGYPGVGRVLVVIPTYNEADNVDIIVGRVRAAVPEVDVLVADDNSPDGTGELADRLGAAYVAGFGWAREHGYEAVVEMDADGSHAPEQLPRLLDALRDHDAVLGSRYVPGGTVVNWPWRREVLSRGGNLYTRICLGVPYRDATGGYRAYRAPVLEKIEIDSVTSQGYCFQIDMIWRAHKYGFRVAEVPITFAERERGASKMSSKIVREAFLRVAVWGTRARWEALRQMFGGKRR